MHIEAHRASLPYSLIYAWMDTEREIKALRKEKAGYKTKEMLDGKRDGWKEGTKIGRRRTDGGEEWERDGEGRGFGRELIFLFF